MKAINRILKEIGEGFNTNDEVFKTILGDADTKYLGTDVDASLLNFLQADFTSLTNTEFVDVNVISTTKNRYASGGEINFTYDDFNFISTSDNYDIENIFVPCGVTNDSNMSIKLVIGDLQWQTSYLNTKFIGMGNNGTAGAMLFQSIAVGGETNWNYFKGTEFNGVKVFILPQGATGDGGGGSLSFYYHKQAWEYALKGSNNDIIITTDGSVYKGTIDRGNLIISGSGEIGKAGGNVSKLSKNLNILTVGDQLWSTESELGINSIWKKYRPFGSIDNYDYSPSVLNMVQFAPINSSGANLLTIKHKDVKWVINTNDVSTQAGDINKTFIASANTPSESNVLLTCDGNWDTFSDFEEGIQIISFPKLNTNDGAGGTVRLYYHEAAWTYAFNGNSSDIVIANDGSIYKDSITQNNLVVNESGEIGEAGKTFPSTNNGGAVDFSISSDVNYTKFADIANGLQVISLPDDKYQGIFNVAPIPSLTNYASFNEPDDQYDISAFTPCENETNGAYLLIGDFKWDISSPITGNIYNGADVGTTAGAVSFEVNSGLWDKFRATEFNGLQTISLPKTIGFAEPTEGLEQQTLPASTITGCIPITDINNYCMMGSGEREYFGSPVESGTWININVVNGDVFLEPKDNSRWWYFLTGSDGIRQFNSFTKNVNFYYSKAAWTIAFKNTSSIVIIVRSGAVFKDVIDTAHCVIDGNGRRGIASYINQEYIDSMFDEPNNVLDVIGFAPVSDDGGDSLLKVGNFEWTNTVGISDPNNKTWAGISYPTGGITEYQDIDFVDETDTKDITGFVPAADTGGSLKLICGTLEFEANTGYGSSKVYSGKNIGTVGGAVKMKVLNNQTWDNFATGDGIKSIQIPMNALTNGIGDMEIGNTFEVF